MKKNGRHFLESDGQVRAPRHHPSERRHPTLTPLERMYGRIVWVGLGFGALFLALSTKLVCATILFPLAPEKQQIAPELPEIVEPGQTTSSTDVFDILSVRRAPIIDRNGQTLALSLPVAQVYGNPMEMIDPVQVALDIKKVLPSVDTNELTKRLSSKKQFVYIARDVSPSQEIAINNLGIPGIYFEAGEKRRYPLGRTAAHLLGGVDIDDRGVAGLERYFDARLRSDHTPLRLSLDIRVQAVVRDILLDAYNEFHAIGAAAIVMDVHTGEILAMISLPDFDANDFGQTPANARFNRAVTGVYEPGSTFKLQTAAMALQYGVAHIWDRFSTIPIHIGRFTISDIKTDHFPPWIAFPDVLAKSSNPAAAHIALDVGAKRQQDWLKQMGFFSRVPIELPEAARPIVPSPSRWGISTVMTVGFGHGIAESPLAIVRGTAAAANGGWLVTPTLLYHDNAANQASRATTEASPLPALSAKKGPASLDAIVAKPIRVLSTKNAEILRRILRLDVLHGTGRNAEVAGYFVGGKTGTAEKIGPNGRYLKHVNVSAFTSIFPMNQPHYAVYVMLDEPHSTPKTHGFVTAGWNAAPTVGKIIARVGPILGVFPDIENATKIDASMAMSLNPTPPRGYRPLGPGNDPGNPNSNKQKIYRTRRSASKSYLPPPQAIRD